MNPTEINEKYPVRNSAWHFDEVDYNWVTERSDLNGKGLDPWGRPFREYPKSYYVCKGTPDEEVGGWRLTTTVEGNIVKLTIFNG